MATKRAVPRLKWYEHLEALTDPLTKRDQAKIREALSHKQSAQFLKDWPRLSEIVWRYAFDSHRADIAHWVRTPKFAKAKDKQLKAALTALDSIVTGIDAFIEHWGPMYRAWHPFDNIDSPEAFAAVMHEGLQAQRYKVEVFAQHGPYKAAQAKLGRPPTPEGYLLDVLVAYFNHRNWEVAIPRHNRPESYRESRRANELTQATAAWA